MEKLEVRINESEVLKGFSWPIKNPKGHIVLMEGMEEHVSRYDGLAKFLNEHGYSVSGIDTYGQGENVEADLSNIGIWPKDGFRKQVTAHHVLIESLKKSGLPVYVFAHSMGSFMGQCYIQMYPGEVNKIVLCGSGAKNPAVSIAYAFARPFVTEKRRLKKSKVLNKLMFGNFNAKIKNPRTAYDWLNNNPDEVDKYIADPLCGFGPRFGFCFEFLKGMKSIYKKSGLSAIDKNLNIFLIAGDQDPVTNYGKYPAVLTKMYAKYGVNNVTSQIFNGLRHELTNEDRKLEVFEAVVNFFDK